MKKLLIFAGVAAVAAANAQIWNETAPDAGELPGTADNTIGVGALTTILGTNLASDTDMFCIDIIDEANFSASTVSNGTTWDTQLFLFDANGFGVTSNDDFGGTLQSRLGSAVVAANGHYYLAISKFNRDPQSGTTNIFTGAFNGSEQLPGTGVGPVTGWVGTTSNTTPQYRIDLTGVGYCTPVPEPATFAALGVGLAALVGLRRRK